ncbi:MAG: hypothetical protein GY765_16110, partial [bacterium]|nr:hypothetical protein [bacterium]
MTRTKILLLAANPGDTDHLRLRKEIDRIREGLSLGENKERFEVVEKWAVSMEHITMALTEHKPQIVHFSGHGEPGGILLQHEDGNAVLMDKAALVRLFGICKDDTKCVLLNACYSDAYAKDIAEHIDDVIGMQDVIQDEDAIKFSLVFYNSLSNGKNIDDSFELALTAIPAAAHIPAIRKKTGASGFYRLDDTDCKHLDIPFLVVAMTRPEADELFLNAQPGELKKIIAGIAGEQNIDDFTAGLLERYGAERLNWKPFWKETQTIKTLVRQSLDT